MPNAALEEQQPHGPQLARTLCWVGEHPGPRRVVEERICQGGGDGRDVSRANGSYLHRTILLEVAPG